MEKKDMLIKQKELERVIGKAIREILDERLVGDHPKGEEAKHLPKEEPRPPHQERPLPPHERPLPPHERPLPPHLKHRELKENLKLNIDFNDKFETLLNIFEEENTADAVIKTLEKSPAEIQIIAKIVLDMHEKIDYLIGE